MNKKNLIILVIILVIASIATLYLLKTKESTIFKEEESFNLDKEALNQIETHAKAKKNNEDIKQNLEANNIDMDISDWKTYTNEEFNFSIKYPSSEKAGEVATNSKLGNTDNYVPGIYIGPLVLIPLEDGDTKEKAGKTIHNLNEQANKEEGEEKGPSITCTSDIVENKTAEITFIECLGSGGIARYAYIDTDQIDFFLDGYSSGYSSGHGLLRYKKTEEIKASLASMLIQ